MRCPPHCSAYSYNLHQHGTLNRTKGILLKKKKKDLSNSRPIDLDVDGRQVIHSTASWQDVMAVVVDTDRVH
jgi:hypothetical protein